MNEHVTQDTSAGARASFGRGTRLRMTMDGPAEREKSNPPGPGRWAGGCQDFFLLHAAKNEKNLPFLSPKAVPFPPGDTRSGGYVLARIPKFVLPLGIPLGESVCFLHAWCTCLLSHSHAAATICIVTSARYYSGNVRARRRGPQRRIRRITHRFWHIQQGYPILSNTK